MLIISCNTHASFRGEVVSSSKIDTTSNMEGTWANEDSGGIIAPPTYENASLESDEFQAYFETAASPQGQWVGFRCGWTQAY